jgi:acetyl esterase
MRTTAKRAGGLALGCVLAGGLAAAAWAAPADEAKPGSAVRPGGAAPMAPADWKAELHPEMKMMLDELAGMNGKPIETLAPAEARLQPTPADAVMSVMKKKGLPMPEPVGKVEDRTITGPAGQIPVRVYQPKGVGPFPVLVYYHGGGFVIATIDTYDSSARALCNAAEAVVVSVEYRKGPEHKFPAAHNDAYAAYIWATQNAASINGRANSVSVGGESAGGNLATAVCLMAKERSARLPDRQILVYPLVQVGDETPSIQKYATAKPLNKPMLAWFGKHYYADPTKDGQAAWASPLKTADLKGLPPATVVTAQIDPLNSEGKLYADKLKAAGVETRYENFEGVTHEFFGMGAVVPEAKKAVAFAVAGLK